MIKAVIFDLDNCLAAATEFGDNPGSELDAGNRLGIRTVQILREGVPRADNATYYVHSLLELRERLPCPEDYAA